MARSRLVRGAVSSAIGAACLSALLHAQPADAPVAEAAMRGDADAVRTLLKDGVDVNAAQGDGMTALHWAAMHGDAALAEMLLYAGANVKATTRIGAYTPLLMAGKHGHAATVAALLAGGADPNLSSSTGATPLMLAAASGNADAVIALLDAGAEIDAREHAREETALMFAAAFNRTAVIEALVARGADVDATTRVVDLMAQTDPEEAAFRQASAGAGNPAPEDTRPAEPPKPEGEKAEGQKAATGEQPAGGGKPADAEKPAEGETAAGRKPAEPEKRADVPGLDRQFRFNELVGTQGGLTPLLFAARQGHVDAVEALLGAGADVNQVSAGDRTSPLLIATVNGHFDLAAYLLEQGADPSLASDAGATPLYAAVNVQWAPKTLYPQPRAYLQQKVTYLDLMQRLLDANANPNARLKKKIWYSGYNFDLSGVDEIGATPFWRAAYASDLEAMRLLVAHGADPNIPTLKPAGRPRTGDGNRESRPDVSGLQPVPVGGPGVMPLLAAAGVGYGEGFAANSHRFAPTGQLAAVKYLVEDLGADVNARDHEGYTALHHAAARGDSEMILYLVSKGADVGIVSREGRTTADMANGPVQRVQPFPDTLALLMRLGSRNSNKCVSC